MIESIKQLGNFVCYASVTHIMHIVIYIVNDRKQRIWTYSIGFMLKRLVAREKYNLQFEILHNSFDTFSSLLLPLIQIHFLNNGFSVP